MALKRFKNKINDKLSNEVIGELETDEEELYEEEYEEYDYEEEPEEEIEEVIKPKRRNKIALPKKQREKKKKEPRQIKPKREKKVPIIPDYDEDEEDEVVEKPSLFSRKKKQESSGSKGDSSHILSILGVKKHLNTKGLLTPAEVSDVEFHLIAPTGLDPRQVSGFANKVERDIYKYIKLLKQREDDIETLADEINRLQSVIQEERQKSELTYFISNQKSQEDQLKDTIIDLRIENERLKSLKAENEELKIKLKRLSEQRQDVVLPSITNQYEENMEEEEEYFFDDDLMIPVDDDEAPTSIADIDDDRIFDSLLDELN